ncbi:MAG: DUF3467 domain-containing protein [Deltaproteobacteria bacterium]|nr:DUF3467 domain-containing protein [Deltaproteobacteria bacterium]
MSEERQDNQKESRADEATPPVQKVRVSTFTHFYTNNIQLGFSNWDMWVTFGELTGQEDNKPTIEERAKVVMSLQHAKAFMQILARSIHEFEKQFGEIKLVSPPQPAARQEPSSSQRRGAAPTKGLRAITLDEDD